ncbi:MAG: type 4a pilus biogenesis protein PilO [Gemmatimonadales bacterium]
MALLDNPKAAPMLGVLFAGLIGYMFYSGEVVRSLGFEGVPVKKEQIKVVQDSINFLEAQTDSVKRDLARGTIEDLKNNIESYKGTLAILRQLVPDRNEVPNLLDDISTRAKIRGVNLAEVVPQPVSGGPAPFDTYTYKMSVIGRYDQIGEFLSDIASLRRIIVPYEVTLASARMPEARALGDTTKAMLEARFQIRTYVKGQPVSPEGGQGGH